MDDMMNNSLVVGSNRQIDPSRRASKGRYDAG